MSAAHRSLQENTQTLSCERSKEQALAQPLHVCCCFFFASLIRAFNFMGVRSVVLQRARRSSKPTTGSGFSLLSKPVYAKRYYSSCFEITRISSVCSFMPKDSTVRVLKSRASTRCVRLSRTYSRSTIPFPFSADTTKSQLALYRKRECTLRLKGHFAVSGPKYCVHGKGLLSGSVAAADDVN